jgi:hypothetical protein
MSLKRISMEKVYTRGAVEIETLLHVLKTAMYKAVKERCRLKLNVKKESIP